MPLTKERREELRGECKRFEWIMLHREVLLPLLDDSEMLRKVSKSETLCEHCKGYGEEWVYVAGIRLPNSTRCPECNGTGKVVP